MFDLSGKTALITGASGGIGKEIARAFHEAGAKVGLGGTRVDVLETLARELGDDAFPMVSDLSGQEGAASLIAMAEETLGGVDILINNAGITRDNLAVRMKDEDWEQVLAVNLSSAFKLSKAVLRGMMKRRSGRIINITSVVGVTGNAGQTNYAASKAGIIGMSKSLAQEVASRGITVNCVAPGFIETPMTDALPDEQKAALATTIPAGRLGESKDIAAGCVYLASDEASYITGQTLHINGGMAMI